MLWEIEIHPKGEDPERARVNEEYALLAHTDEGAGVITRSGRGFVVKGDLGAALAVRLLSEILVDPLTETGRIEQLKSRREEPKSGPPMITVMLKPGVMDPVALSVVDVARKLDIPVESVRTFRRYYLRSQAWRAGDTGAAALRRILANDAIEQLLDEPLSSDHLTPASPYDFRIVRLALLRADEAGLERISREGQLSLSLTEMRAIQAYFRGQGRDPTDVELETLAQTWSEHCSHKTLKGKIDFETGNDVRHFDNLLRETIFGATQEIRRRLGPDDWCISVFEDNAGVVRFDDR